MTNKKYLIFLLIWGGLFISFWSSAQEKRALLIGISKYPRGNGWNNLSSDNDLIYLSKVLEIKGFKKDNIATLQDEKATFAGISKAVEDFIASCKPGDVVMLHYSGHGQQITDDNGDEPDGYDEAWVPYNAQGTYDPTEYTGSMHIRDDQINEWVNRLSEKVGKNGTVLITMDACHSGTATRSQNLAIARGTPTPFKIPNMVRKEYGTVKETQNDFLNDANLGKANVVVFSASSPIQINYETKDANDKGVGSLSYGFAMALADLPAGASYNDLFYRIKARVQAVLPEQIPMMEGNGQQQLFAGNYLVGLNAIFIDRWSTDSTFLIKQGQLQQIAAGAEFAILDPQTKRQVAIAKATQVTLVETMAITSAKLDKSKLWEIKILSLPAPPYTLQVDYDLKNFPKSWIGPLDKAIATFGFTQKNKLADCWIGFIPDTGLVVFTRQNALAYMDGTVKNGKLNPNSLEELKKVLQQIAKTNYIRSLPDGGTLAGTLEWKVIPKSGTGTNGQDIVFTKGSLFDFSLKNNGDKPVFFELINILPNGEMSLLLPDAESAVEDFSIQPGEAFTISDNMIPDDAWEGREFLKVMVSETAFDMRPVFIKQAKKRGGTLTSWEQAMQGIMQDDAALVQRKRSVSVNEMTLLTQSFLIK